MPRSEHRLLALSTLATVVVAVAAALAGHIEAVAYAAPVVVLMLPLVGGRYLGEDQIVRLAERRRVEPKVRAASVRPRRRGPVVLVARGTRLMARSLAARPPPVPALS